MTVGPRARALIAAYEGDKLVAYAATADERARGIWTIGKGMTHYPDGSPVKQGDIITQAQSDSMFAALVDQRGEAIAPLLTAPTTPAQFGALVSLSYNIGLAGLARSTLLQLHNAGDYAGAAAQFARWNRQGLTVLPGLTRRRAAEAALYRGEA